MLAWHYFSNIDFFMNWLAKCMQASLSISDLEISECERPPAILAAHKQSNGLTPYTITHHGKHMVLSGVVG